MPGTRIPTEVLVARGAKHLGKGELEKRRAQEAKPSRPVKRLLAPDWLPDEQRGAFNRIAKAVVDLMPDFVARTDADTIANYCVVYDAWKMATNHANAALNNGDLNAARDWGLVQDRYFKQAMACAAALGLTVSARCRLVVPKPAERAEDNPFAALRERLRA